MKQSRKSAAKLAKRRAVYDFGRTRKGTKRPGSQNRRKVA